MSDFVCWMLLNWIQFYWIGEMVATKYAVSRLERQISQFEQWEKEEFLFQMRLIAAGGNHGNDTDTGFEQH